LEGLIVLGSANGEPCACIGCYGRGLCTSIEC